MTNWELLGSLKSWHFKATAYSCSIMCKMTLAKHTCVSKMHLVHMLCYTTLEFVCSTARDWTKAYIIGHVVVCVRNSSGVVIHIFLPPDLFSAPWELQWKMLYTSYVLLILVGGNNSIEHCLGSFMLALEVCWCYRKWIHFLPISKRQSREVAASLWRLNGALLQERFQLFIIRCTWLLEKSVSFVVAFVLWSYLAFHCFRRAHM